MSAIYMCDNCGNVFSVNEQGWREFTEQTNESNNSYNHGARTRHIGPYCNLGQGGVVRPRVIAHELETGKIV